MDGRIKKWKNLRKGKELMKEKVNEKRSNISKK